MDHANESYNFIFGEEITIKDCSDDAKNLFTKLMEV